MNERWSRIQQSVTDIKLDAFSGVTYSLDRANACIENCIGILGLPLGLGLNFLINGKNYQVPMATEEASVIAAASAGAKFIAETGNGFVASTTAPIMRGQIQVLDVELDEAQAALQRNRKRIIKAANKYCESMIKRGGGVVGMEIKMYPSSVHHTQSSLSIITTSMLVVDLLINTGETMGANLINHVCESTAPLIAQITKGRIGLKILSNLCVERRATCEFKVPVIHMAYKGLSGQEVSKRILEAYHFALVDVSRCTTHNKGILNGIDAVAVALGQDTRQIEASCHAWAALQKSGSGYSPLTHYQILDNKEGEPMFYGKIEIPIAIGRYGGALKNNPIYEENIKILGFPSAAEIGTIMAAVGLAQNFSALRSLISEGIQTGHMRLHARSLCLAADVPLANIEEAVQYMIDKKRFDRATAAQFALRDDDKGETSTGGKN